MGCFIHCDTVKWHEFVTHCSLEGMNLYWTFGDIIDCCWKLSLLHHHRSVEIFRFNAKIGICHLIVALCFGWVEGEERYWFSIGLQSIWNQNRFQVANSRGTTKTPRIKFSIMNLNNTCIRIRESLVNSFSKSPHTLQVLEWMQNNDQIYSIGWNNNESRIIPR